ncbi:hypothetical protein F5X68DRAFT_260302 [Plectosphaerella plurivora]|uniref:F-box domain-containing protein n=1 Tax=Plectosphaerella plurivora TaxID=936078 RepID=A0A9P8VDK7_9PEZI|nr:hypothetical protein F5X68DRAFT_260302 [Plectosphaerella plurivora]
MSDDLISWNVHILDLPPELHNQIFTDLHNLKSVIALRQTCRKLEGLYQNNATTILRSQRDRLIVPFRVFYEFLSSWHDFYDVDDEITPLSPESHIVNISDGWEGGGLTLILDTLNGVIIEQPGPEGGSGTRLPPEEYFEARMAMLERCEEVFVPSADVHVIPEKSYRYGSAALADYDGEKMDEL